MLQIHSLCLLFLLVFYVVVAVFFGLKDRLFAFVRIKNQMYALSYQGEYCGGRKWEITMRFFVCV